MLGKKGRERGKKLEQKILAVEGDREGRRKIRGGKKIDYHTGRPRMTGSPPDLMTFELHIVGPGRNLGEFEAKGRVLKD